MQKKKCFKKLFDFEYNSLKMQVICEDILLNFYGNGYPIGKWIICTFGNEDYDVKCSSFKKNFKPSNIGVFASGNSKLFLW